MNEDLAAVKWEYAGLIDFWECVVRGARGARLPFSRQVLLKGQPLIIF